MERMPIVRLFMVGISLVAGVFAARIDPRQRENTVNDQGHRFNVQYYPPGPELKLTRRIDELEAYKERRAKLEAARAMNSQRSH